MHGPDGPRAAVVLVSRAGGGGGGGGQRHHKIAGMSGAKPFVGFHVRSLILDAALMGMLNGSGTTLQLARCRASHAPPMHPLLFLLQLVHYASLLMVCVRHDSTHAAPRTAAPLVRAGRRLVALAVPECGTPPLAY